MSRIPDKSTAARRASLGDPLTRRELEILALVAAGEPSAAIAEQLGIVEATIKTHLTSVYRKTGCRNRVQAARHYAETYASSRVPESAPPAPDVSAMPLLERQIQEIEARIDSLSGAAAELERLRAALATLRAIQRG